MQTEPHPEPLVHSPEGTASHFIAHASRRRTTGCDDRERSPALIIAPSGQFSGSLFRAVALICGLVDTQLLSVRCQGTPKWGTMGSADRRGSAANAAPMRATTLAVVAACMLPAGAARAQFLFWPQQTSWWGDHAPLRHKRRHRHIKPQSAGTDQAQNSPNGPLEIIISIADQRITVYDDGALIARSSVSTGVPRHPTPTGVFSVISKQLWHRSNIYSAAPMPYMQRITWSGIALHAGVVPGHPASHGCIRLKNDFAVRLWHLTRRGTRVIIARDDIRPVEIANPKLVVSKSKAVSGPPGRHCGRRHRCGSRAFAASGPCRDDTNRRFPNPGIASGRGHASKTRPSERFCESQIAQALRASGLRTTVRHPGRHP
jgi:hypothetical protein